MANPIPIPPTGPASNTVVPFLRPAPAAIPPLAPVGPAPAAPGVLVPIPPQQLKDPTAPGGFLDNVQQLEEQLPPAVPEATPALPTVLDVANDALDPFSPEWDEAPWNQPDTPASLVPPTEIPTGEYPVGDTGRASGAFTSTLIVTVFNTVTGTRDLTFSVQYSGIPLYWRQIAAVEESSPGGPVYSYDKFYFYYQNPSGDVVESYRGRFIPASRNDQIGDRAIGYQRKITYTQPFEEFDQEDELKVPAPVGFIPLPESPPIPKAPPVPQPLPLVPPAPDPGPIPAPQPEEPPIPEEDPVPVIPTNPPLPAPTPVPVEQLAPPVVPDLAPPGGPPPKRTPVPIPGQEPEVQEERKLPPPPFDLCEDPCIEAAKSSCVVLLRDRTAFPIFSQVLDFSTSLIGQQSQSLPPGIATVEVDYLAVSPNLTTYGGVDDGDIMGQYGTLIVQLDGRRVLSYSLNRFGRVIVELPYSSSGVYSVLIVPSYYCTVAINDIGDRWQFVSVSDPQNLPTVTANVLN